MPQSQAPWTLLTNHAHVLLCISRDHDARLRDIADQVGITERAVQKIVTDLVESGYLTVKRIGRRNQYRVHPRKPLRHPLERNRRAGELMELLQESPRA